MADASDFLLAAWLASFRAEVDARRADGKLPTMGLVPSGRLERLREKAEGRLSLSHDLP